MRIIHDKIDSFTFGSVCALGNFDGIHLAHQKIILHARQYAGSEKKCGVITFHPQPVSVFHKNEIFFLTTNEEKQKILSELGIDFIYYIKFDKDLSQKNPEEFIDFVCNTIRPSLIVVGENFHFGKDRKGNAKILKEIAQNKFAVEIVSKIKDNEGIISSTRIRELLLLGHIPAANRLLGREYSITGKVIKGKGKGTFLGYPTINLTVDREKLLPLDGVYEVSLDIAGVTYKGAMFLSHNSIEVHILNFTGNLYDKNITLKLIRRLRMVKKFTSDELLKKAIAEDIRKISGSKT